MPTTAQLPPETATELKTRMTRQLRKVEDAAIESAVAPEAVVGTALAEWCGQNYAELPPPGLKFFKRRAKKTALRSFVQTLRGLDFLEASYWLSTAYAMLSDDGHPLAVALRNSDGLAND